MHLLDDFTKHIGFVFIATLVVNLCNYLFHIFMSRTLGPTDYGIMVSLFSVVMIISVPAGVLQTVTTKYISNFKAKGELAKVKILLHRLITRVSLFGIGGFILFILLSGHIASFLHIPSRLPIVLVAVALVLGIICPVLLGTLQGLQKFVYFGTDMMIGGIGKLFFGILLVYVGLKVNGALLGLAMGSLAAFLFAIFPLRRQFAFDQTDCEINLSPIYGYFFPVAAMLLCFTLLTNIDLVLVRHFFEPSQAGHYAAASIVAKIILFLPGAIAMVMFPKTSELHALSQESKPVLKKSLLYTALLSGSVLLLYLAVPSLIVKSLFGSQYIPSIPLIGIFGLAMLFFSLTNILLFYQISVHQLKFLKILVVATIVEVALIFLFHASLIQVILILAVVSLSLFLLNSYYVFAVGEKEPGEA